MIKGKKSIGYGSFAALILVLVVAFILLNYTGALAGIIKKESDIEVCRLSVLSQAQSKFFGKTHLSLKCPRREVKFFNDKVEINRKKDDKYEFKQLDDNVVNKVIAEELRLCWYMMGEGSVNVFRQDIVFGYDKVCAVCSEISFNKGVDKNKQFKGLVEYLKVNYIPKENVYYFGYLVRSQKEILQLLGGFIYTPWIFYGTTGKVEESSFQSSENYVVYFMAFKSSWLNEKADQILGTENAHTYYIGLGKPGNVAKECRRLAN